MMLSVFSLNIELSAQNLNVKGKVSDSEGNALSGVAVLVKGDSKGVVSNSDGSYRLDNVSGESTLVFTLIGYAAQEIKVGSRETVDVTLIEKAEEFDEVVVIGYGTARRRDYAGSIGSIKVEDSPIAILPNLNALDALKGTVTGMNITANNKDGVHAGEDPDMLIRGQNSINGSNTPLIILDGVIFLGSIGDINPNDIASYDILKDAVSSAVYGSRSSNGVISITTKKGRTGKPVITLNATTGIQTWTNYKPKFANGPDWLNDFNVLNGRTPDDVSTFQPEIQEQIQLGNDRDMLDMITHTGSIQDYQIAVSGASKDINYYLSTSYEYNHGVFIGDKFNRISVLGKIDTNITDWLNIGLDAGFSRRDYSGLQVDFGGMQMGSPYMVLYREIDPLTFTGSAGEPLWGIENPEGLVDDGDYRYNYRMNAYATVKIPWIKGLSYKINFLPNLDRREESRFYYEPYYQLSIPGPWTSDVLQGLLSRANGYMKDYQTFNYVFDNVLTYDNKFGKHNVTATLVATRDFSRYDYKELNGKDFVDNGNTSLGIGGLAKATTRDINLDVWERSNIGYLGRIIYGYNDRYIINASLRRDGASVFGANNKWGNFASLGGSWIASEEQFVKNLDFFNFLKLSLTFGQNGNQGLDPYKILSRVNNGQSRDNPFYTFSNTPGVAYFGITQSSLGNDNMGWEKTSAWNIGLETSFWKNRINLNLDLYSSKTTDQIFERIIPSMTGFEKIFASMGQVDNKGVELTLKTVNIQNRDWTWSTFVTFWKNKNKLVKLYGDDLDGDGKEDDDVASSLFIGESLKSIYGYKQTGIVQEEDTEYTELTGIQPGNPKYDDMVDGIPGLTPEDRMILGTEKENFRLNFGTNLKYKNLELYVMAVGVFGGNNQYMKANQLAFTHYEGGRMVFDEATYLNRPYWTPENRSNVYPKHNFNWRGDGRILGLQTRTWVRIQDISLSYNLSGMSFLKSLNVSSLKLFFAAKNVAVFTNWFGTDPEIGSGWMDGNYPVMATYSLGLNLSF
jgi:TonB-linked SusC/RagA family outer membrane protein